MRFRTLCLSVLSTAFLSGCTTLQPGLKSPHTIQLDFMGGNTCTAYFIKDDTVSYEFSKPGTYTINPDQYLLIYNCGQNKGMKSKMLYAPGTKTEISANLGIRTTQFE